MSENDPHDVLDYYGKRIPLGIAENAYYRYAGERNREHPKNVASLRESDGETLGEITFEFYKVQVDDGVLVRGRDGNRWALTDDIVTTCVARLVKTTDLVVVDGEDSYIESSVSTGPSSTQPVEGDDEYLPPLGDGDDSEGPWASWVTADEKADNDDGGDAILTLMSDDTPPLDDLVIEDVEFDFDRNRDTELIPAFKFQQELTDVAGVGIHKANALYDGGYESKEDLREASQQELADVEGINNALAARIKADFE